jgi:hypothetical protein
MMVRAPERFSGQRRGSPTLLLDLGGWNTNADGSARMINVAINGLGRIGRATLEIVMETPG